MSAEIPSPKKPLDSEEAKEERRKLFALAAAYGLPAFRDVEPPGGYDTTGQPGDLIEGVKFDINPDLERSA